MVSKEMVDKLKLCCETHPHPYRIACFKKGNVITINKRCLIIFSINDTYKYQLWCDIIPMDAEKAGMMEERIPKPFGRMDRNSSSYPLRMREKLRICCQKESLLRKRRKQDSAMH